jgi:hypothetical protein
MGLGCRALAGSGRSIFERPIRKAAFEVPAANEQDLDE